MQERALARSVAPDNGDPLTRIYSEGDAIQEGTLPECLGDLLNIHQISAGHAPILLVVAVTPRTGQATTVSRQTQSTRLPNPMKEGLFEKCRPLYPESNGK
jgi:hypothetical protein